MRIRPRRGGASGQAPRTLSTEPSAEASTSTSGSTSSGRSARSNSRFFASISSMESTSRCQSSLRKLNKRLIVGRYGHIASGMSGPPIMTLFSPISGTGQGTVMLNAQHNWLG